ncbi:hypothetical protein A8O37_30805 [Pseudomonas aeruginosa]|nr:hypothetical protein A8O37_30805 [Pseudomonas aeruginosa]
MGLHLIIRFSIDGGQRVFEAIFSTIQVLVKIDQRITWQLRSYRAYSLKSCLHFYMGLSSRCQV